MIGGTTRRKGVPPTASAEAAKEAPPFFDDLNRRVGHDGVTPIVWRVGGYAVVVRGSRILTVQGPSTPERWDLPGGGVHPDEDLVAGIVREVWEETGYRFVPTGPAHFAGDEFFFVPPRVTPTPYRHNLCFVVRGEVSDDRDPGWHRDRDEIETVSWVDLSALSPRNTIAYQWQGLVGLGLVTAEA